MITFSRSSGTFPARDMIAGWLKAGVFEAGKGFAPTGEGTPQGGVISPCLLNVALHGLEEAAGVRYQTSGHRAGDPRPAPRSLVRYADDWSCSATARSRPGRSRRGWRVAGAEGPGLQRGQDEDRPPQRGFRLPGLQRPPLPNRKLLIKPSKAAVRRLRERLAAEMRTLRGGNAMAVIATLNPVIRGSPGDASLLHDVA